MKKIVLASTNPGKIKDYQELTRNTAIQIIPQSELGIPEADETGLTFVENALIKARNASEMTGLPVIGEDSGLIVDALNGAPGLYSARFAGKGATDKENITALLKALSNTSNPDRKARFYAVIVLLRYPHDPAPLICEGIWEGEILPEPRGENGFGYLPIFYVPTHKQSGAELSLEERIKINHRSEAFRKLRDAYFSS